MRARVQVTTRKRGIVVRASDAGVSLSPPLILTREQAEEVLGALADSLDEVLG